jgi:FxsC-like protein
MSLVFFSYARTDRDAHLDRFFDDLESRVALYGGPPRGEVLFRDTSDIELGERWPEELSLAIARAKVLLCVCTPTYFSRPWCGKEFSFFRARVTAYAKAQDLAQPPPLILPILWIPEKKGGRRFPEVIRDLQSDQGFGPDYEKLGLWVVTKLQKYEDTYDEIVGKIAERILAVAQEHPLPDHTEPFELRDVPDAFAPAPAAAPAAIAPPVDRGPRHVQFFVIAGPRSKLAGEGVRKNVEPYGEEPTDWRPFLPPAEGRIGPLLQGIAAEEDFTSDVVEPSADLIPRIEAACKENNLVLLVVDPWTLRIEVYSEWLKQYDQRDFLHATVLVAWNGADEETKETKEVLEAVLRDTFANKAAADDPRRYKGGILTLDQLKSEVRTALIEVRKRILDHADIARRARGARIAKPVISAVKVG